MFCESESVLSESAPVWNGFATAGLKYTHFLHSNGQGYRFKSTYCGERVVDFNLFVLRYCELFVNINTTSGIIDIKILQYDIQGFGYELITKIFIRFHRKERRCNFTLKVNLSC